VDETSKGRPQPIISAAYDITDNLVARVSWALRYSRPPFEGATGTLRNIRVDEDEDGIGGSLSILNPNIDISKTNSYQAGLTYYTNSGGKFGINGYYDVEEDREVSVEFDPGLTPNRWETLMTELGYGPGDRYYDEEWTVSTSINARGTFINFGYELEASQDMGAFFEVLKGVYVFASLNHKFQKEGSVAEEEQDLGFFDEPKDPEIDASGGINYRFKRFSARVNWTWRGERVRSFGEAVVYPQPTVGNAGWYTPDPNDAVDTPYLIQTRVIRPEELRLDVNLSYRINDTFTVDFAARNITASNKPDRLESVIPGLIPTFAAVENRSDFGVNFTIGLTAEF
ncbi:MAG TPA: TonB-dependent receptor, partial [Oceanipulchritudo sp.]|nr:TonB-dependent receptor [Oceanipulchritudo sp.]